LSPAGAGGRGIPARRMPGAANGAYGDMAGNAAAENQIVT